MLLREFIYFDKTRSDMHDQERYAPEHDKTIWKKSYTRNIKLTLGMINDLRKASEVHEKEIREEHGLVRKMYAVPPPEAGAAPGV